MKISGIFRFVLSIGAVVSATMVGANVAEGDTLYALIFTVLAIICFVEVVLFCTICKGDD